MSKLDLTKTDKTYYNAKINPEIVFIEKANYISLTGQGDPSGKDFSEKIQALYTTAYVIKFMHKAMDNDFVVPKLEALWSFDTEKYASISMDEAPLKIPRAEWNYRIMIRMPDFVTREQTEKAIAIAVNKKQNELAKAIEFFEMEEGKVIQVLHIGPFDTEPQTLKKILEFSIENNLQQNGLHHEIYLSDFRKTAPEKLKTILREPVK
ncbi:Bacterial transcription activator, effector binding domain [Flavobacterium anhuiense]|uniref:Bacterial transcription activator, effector binding domain n=1 Tax=Flavobacterium anhuiense TaxID=459526 RepID=A0AAC9GGS3_9FLAO|nr:GyrI-like domain-containing protein [Flavobacterium anhuiense]AOC93518.1 Bacterial transcription activator, effector binding domain [Flavobacterium anhuiense]